MPDEAVKPPNYDFPVYGRTLGELTSALGVGTVYGGHAKHGKTWALEQAAASGQQALSEYASALGAQAMQNQWAAQMARYQELCGQRRTLESRLRDAENAVNSRLITADDFLRLLVGDSDRRGGPADS